MDPAVLLRLEQGDQAVFDQLVAALSCNDNFARKNAEDVYEQLLESRSSVTLKMLTVGLGHPTMEMKSFCTVMLRKVRLWCGNVIKFISKHFCLRTS